MFKQKVKPNFFAVFLHSMHYYYSDSVLNSHIELDDQESAHCLKVMRKKSGDTILVLNGRGSLYTCEIVDSKRRILAKIISEEFREANNHLSVAIAPTKNADRMEFMVEKLVEIGVAEIIFLQTDNSERSKMQARRIQMKAIGALKQSKAFYLPEIFYEVSMDTLCSKLVKNHNYLAHCYDTEDKFALAKDKLTNGSKLIAIGPEGDFSLNEVALAKKYGFTMLDLGEKRLRTETAALVACTLFNALDVKK
jgi:16S rRNA (uracil1498-N3)-methyltransferase